MTLKTPQTTRSAYKLAEEAYRKIERLETHLANMVDIVTTHCSMVMKAIKKMKTQENMITSKDKKIKNL